MKLEIRRALSDESETLSMIAHTAKRHWGYPESWIEQWREQLTITPDFIRNNRVFAALSEGNVIGCCALVESIDKLELEHMWTLPEFIGKGVGRALFEHAVRSARSLSFKEFEITSDPNAEGFYKHMGAKRIGEVV